MFLHGYLSSKESFAFQTEYLSSFFKTVAVDLPGFGKTPEPDEPLSLDGYVEFVKSIIERECGKSTLVLAHSFGGRIALKLAARYPETVEQMLLTGCAGMRPRRTLGYRARRLGFKAVKLVSPSLARRWIRAFASPDYLALSPLMRESFKMIVNEHLDGILPYVSVPTLLVFGSEDKETPLYMAGRLNRGIHGSGLVVMEGCGHFCFCDDPVRFNAIAREFLL